MGWHGREPYSSKLRGRSRNSSHCHRSHEGRGRTRRSRHLICDGGSSPAPHALAHTIGAMFGGGSITLFHFRGIKVTVDWSWFIVLFLVIIYMAGFFEDLLGEGGSTPFLLALLGAVGFFGSILLHEFGHAVVAMRNGIGISSIQLWIFGGMARMDREADSAGTEAKVALGGPAVTLAIAVVLAAV